jgi:hypothetical protein
VSGSGAPTRRDLLKLAAGAAAATPLLRVEAALAAPAAPRFLSGPELALLDELVEILIPADDHSPGARAAGCAACIDGRLADAFLPVDAEWRQRWRDGLARVDELSREMHGARFTTATAEQRTAVVARMAANEGAPQAPEERFFGELKAETIRAYYTSKIGIHQEMEYKGNTLLAEFAGEDPAD